MAAPTGASNLIGESPDPAERSLLRGLALRTTGAEQVRLYGLLPTSIGTSCARSQASTALRSLRASWLRTLSGTPK